MKKELLIEIAMVRNDLLNIPDIPLPSPYTIRNYSPADKNIWVNIQQQADIYHPISLDTFHIWFGHDENELARRMFFLCDETGKEIGTASAWFDERFRGCLHGRIHWVAIIPKMQGKKLSKPLISHLCRKFKELGHDRACLTTESVRIWAINLYSQFGFVPAIDSEYDLKIWQEIQKNGAKISIPEINKHL